MAAEVGAREAAAAEAAHAAAAEVGARTAAVVGAAADLAAVGEAHTEAVLTDTKLAQLSPPQIGAGFFFAVFPGGSLLTTLRRHRCFVE